MIVLKIILILVAVLAVFFIGMFVGVVFMGEQDDYNEEY